jgi:hypothetical protein
VDVQRNLLTPIAEMGLDIRVETRTGDTPSDRKTRQRIKPPQILLTTPESLSLLLSHEDSFGLFGDLSTIVVDEITPLPRASAATCCRSPWRGCSGSRRTCAGWGFRPPCPIRKPIRAGWLLMRMLSWSTW